MVTHRSDVGSAVPMSRRAQNRARTRAAILSASLACFAEAGVQATTMDQIAAAAAVARATLFNYFPAKADIVVALVAEHDENFFLALDGWRRRPGLTTGERLLGLFVATAHYLRRAPARKRVIIRLSWTNWAEPASAERIRRVGAGFAALLADGRARGDIPAHVDPVLAGETIGDVYMGLVHRWWMNEPAPGPDHFDRTARLLAQMVSPGAPLPAHAPASPIFVTHFVE
ncbi:AcrR family transcriptional regulator [Sphingomonas zeicaulis]|uniref:TetR/AcrR family transcriptional regulator n=1 Tax=Sphingomonas zeicaulis TaxID=1632740 RepID=UPI003D1CEEEF